MLIRTETIENGDYLMPFNVFECDNCGLELPESAPREDIGGKNYCGDCAFRLGLIDDKTYLQDHAYFIALPNLRAEVHDGEIYISDSKFPWERSSRERECKAYKEWRESVYERDNWTCKHCGQKGGKLNAHHIKSYAKYPELRLDVNNGITLCLHCHKAVHKKRKEVCENE